MTGPVPPRLGHTLVLAEEQYKFGVGPMLCRVTGVISLVYFDDEPWWHVNGMCAPGTPANHGGWSPREAYVSAAALSGQRG